MADHSTNGSKIGKRRGKGDSSSEPLKQSGDVITNGLNEYDQLTQSAFSQTLKTFFTKTMMPLCLIIIAPIQVFSIWYTVMRCEGSYLKMISVFSTGFMAGISKILSQVKYPTWPVICTLIGYSTYALVMMKLLPGKTVTGPLTPKGNVPVYKDNGFKFYLLTIALFWLLSVVLHPLGITPSILYDRYDEVLFALNAFSLAFCLFLYFKGRFAPSSTDCGSSGNFIFDYYWGTELYPRVFGFDVKLFTNCRFGMMIWALMACVHAVKSYELYGFVDSMFVSVSLQLFYITKFFWWENGYLRTIDIMLDRAGFYICWGCMVFVPGLYTSVSFYLVSHPIHLGPYVTTLFMVFGLLSIYVNYEADMQKQDVRQANGDCLIWGKKPEIIRAQYKLENGDVKESILLASGWWGMSRHFHYIPEILLAFFWTVPALFDNLLPYTYLFWLTMILVHRTYRDDTKCGKKYGPFWQQYCKKVPHKVVPYLF